jgi:mono-ADP-ribosyltransferase sirtuin 6
LHDTIINFGEDLPERAFSLAYEHAKKADLCLVLGSSLTVTPANTIPEIVGQRKKAKLAICNLQKTPLDDDTDLRIHAKADDLMILIMKKLEIPIPPFILRRRLAVEVETQSAERHQLKVYGIDVDGTPVTFLRSVKLEHSRRVARTEPFVISIRDRLEYGALLKLELEFMGHYGEPNLVIAHEFDGGAAAGRQGLYLLEYDPRNGEWRTSKLDGLV